VPRLSREELRDAYSAEIIARVAERKRAEAVTKDNQLPELAPPKPSYPRRCTMSKRHGKGRLARPRLSEGVHPPGVAREMKARLNLRIQAERAARIAAERLENHGQPG